MIATVESSDLDDLLPLMRDYCTFYGTDPSDAALMRLSRALIDDPTHEGTQLIARDRGRAVGFATLFWSWSTTVAARQAILHDLFVAESARGSGIAQALIDICAVRAREHGCEYLAWTTAPDNTRAQSVYDKTSAERSTWIEYSMRL